MSLNLKSIEEYNLKALQDLFIQSQNEIQNLRSELSTATSELTTTKSELSTTKSELSTTKSVLTTINSELTAAKFEIKKAESEIKTANLTIKLLQLKVLGISLENRKIPPAEMIDMFEDMDVEVIPTQEAAAQDLQPSESLVVEKPRKKRKPEDNRHELPSELPRRVTVLDVAEEDRKCPQTGKPLKQIGIAVTEHLEIEPPKFFVARTERPLYACKDHPEEGVTCMSIPQRIINKGIPGESLLAYVLTSKFVDHLPLERISRILDRSGVKISRSTLSEWLILCGRKLEPLRLALMRKILESHIINADETTYKVLQNHDRKKSVKGYLWGYIGDRKYLLFEWNDGRGSSHPLSFLEGASCEWLQTDAYSGYAPVFDDHSSMLSAGCWAHVRRKYAEAESVGEKAASPFLDLIARLYQVESELREKGAEANEILQKRESESRDIVRKIHKLALEVQGAYPPKNLMYKALTYMLNHWTALTAYLTDGRLEIDNNIIERAIRPVTLGRKNWLFSGSEHGAQTAALVISLVGTCALCKVDASKYLRNLLRILPNFKGEDYAALLPDALSVQLNELDNLP